MLEEARHDVPLALEHILPPCLAGLTLGQTLRQVLVCHLAHGQHLSVHVELLHPTTCEQRIPYRIEAAAYGEDFVLFGCLLRLAPQLIHAICGDPGATGHIVSGRTLCWFLPVVVVAVRLLLYSASSLLTRRGQLDARHSQWSAQCRIGRSWSWGRRWSRCRNWHNAATIAQRCTGAFGWLAGSAPHFVRLWLTARTRYLVHNDGSDVTWTKCKTTRAPYAAQLQDRLTAAAC